MKFIKIRFLIFAIESTLPFLGLFLLSLSLFIAGAVFGVIQITTNKLLENQLIEIKRDLQSNLNERGNLINQIKVKEKKVLGYKVFVDHSVYDASLPSFFKQTIDKYATDNNLSVVLIDFPKEDEKDEKRNLVKRNKSESYKYTYPVKIIVKGDEVSIFRFFVTLRNKYFYEIDKDDFSMAGNIYSGTILFLIKDEKISETLKKVMQENKL